MFHLESLENVKTVKLPKSCNDSGQAGWKSFGGLLKENLEEKKFPENLFRDWLLKHCDVNQVIKGKKRIFLVKLVENQSVYSAQEQQVLEKIIIAARRKKEIHSEKISELFFAVESDQNKNLIDIHVGNLNILSCVEGLIAKVDERSAVEVFIEDNDDLNYTPINNIFS